MVRTFSDRLQQLLDEEDPQQPRGADLLGKLITTRTSEAAVTKNENPTPPPTRKRKARK